MVVDRTIWDCYISTAIKITEPSKERLSSLWSDELGSVIFNKARTNVWGPYSPITVNLKRNNRLTIYSLWLYIVIRL